MSVGNMIHTLRTKSAILIEQGGNRKLWANSALLLFSLIVFFAAESYQLRNHIQMLIVEIPQMANFNHPKPFPLLAMLVLGFAFTSLIYGILELTGKFIAGRWLSKMLEQAAEELRYRFAKADEAKADIYQKARDLEQQQLDILLGVPKDIAELNEKKLRLELEVSGLETKSQQLAQERKELLVLQVSISKQKDLFDQLVKDLAAKIKDFRDRGDNDFIVLVSALTSNGNVMRRLREILKKETI